MSEVNDVLNTGMNITDPQQSDAVDMNNTVLLGFYYTLFFFVIVGGIYVIKPENPEGVYYE
jgi:hypothetical protein